MATGLENQRLPEEWRDVRGYEGYYQVSSHGRVRRVKGGQGARAGHFLSLKKPRAKCDYIRVELCRRDSKRTFGVHALVAGAFHGPRPRGKFPNHRNFDKHDNCESNLEWMTRKQNAQHALRAGRYATIPPLPGELNGRAKLTVEQVAEIRLQKSVIGQRTLARLCGVSKSAIQFIHQGKHWK